MDKDVLLRGYLFEFPIGSDELDSDEMISSISQNSLCSLNKDVSLRGYMFTPQVELSAISVTSVNGRTGDVVLTKDDVDLSNVDNTSDINKPISTATQEALDDKSTVTASSSTVQGASSAKSINIDGTDYNLVDGSSVTDYDELTGRPKYNNSTITSSTNIPEVKTSIWDAKQDALTDGSGIIISNNEISADTTFLQKKLTAGDRITINQTTNEISSSSDVHIVTVTLDGTTFSASETIAQINEWITAKEIVYCELFDMYYYLSQTDTSDSNPIFYFYSIDETQDEVYDLKAYIDDNVDVWEFENNDKSYTAGNGINVTNHVISADFTNADTSKAVANKAFVNSAVSEKYTKPSDGIPKSDLSNDVQTSLNKADTALQEHQSLSAYRTASAQDVIDSTKADETDLTSHTSNTSNPHSVTAYQVGLGNVDNTSDMNKPVSTATQNAINSEEERATLAESALQNSISTINSKIPSDATSSNQLADKAWVSSNGGKIDTASVNGVQQTITNKNLEIPLKTINGSSINASGNLSLEVADSTILKQSNVVDNYTSTSTIYPLSASKGKDLNERLQNVEARGRYLSTWNCVTGLAGTTPTTLPYTYKTGDYFIVSNIGSTNYKPNGSSYTGIASTTIDSSTISVNDTYLYDGTSWTLIHSTEQTVTFSSIAGSPNDNTNLKNALDNKQDDINFTYDSNSAISEIDSHYLNAKYDSAGNVIASTYQEKLSNQTSYTSKGTSTKVPQITTNTLGQVTNITEVTITQPTVNDGTLTIKKGSTSLGTFTANQSTASSIDVTPALSDMGVTATSSELNVLDGITATTQELNYTDGVTSNIQTQINSKYTKPDTGIPKSDLASDVQTSLGKADTALQELDLFTTAEIDSIFA